LNSVLTAEWLLKGREGTFYPGSLSFNIYSPTETTHLTFKGRSWLFLSTHFTSTNQMANVSLKEPVKTVSASAHPHVGLASEVEMILNSGSSIKHLQLHF